MQQHFLHLLPKSTQLGNFNERFKAYASVFFFWFWQKFCQFVPTEKFGYIFNPKKKIPAYFVKNSHWSAVIRTFEGRQQSVINHTQHIPGFDKFVTWQTFIGSVWGSWASQFGFLIKLIQELGR
jgi:hypothetical protein